MRAFNKVRETANFDGCYFYKCLSTSGAFNFLTVSNQAVSRHMLPRSKCSEYFVKNEELK